MPVRHKKYVDPTTNGWIASYAAFSVAHGTGCATKIHISVAHLGQCATEMAPPNHWCRGHPYFCGVGCNPAVGGGVHIFFVAHGHECATERPNSVAHGLNMCHRKWRNSGAPPTVRHRIFSVAHGHFGAPQNSIPPIDSFLVVYALELRSNGLDLTTRTKWP